jgi:hypothetical protein
MQIINKKMSKKAQNVSQRHLGLDVDADADDLVLAAADAEGRVVAALAHRLCAGGVERPSVALSVLLRTLVSVCAMRVCAIDCVCGSSEMSRRTA